MNLNEQLWAVAKEYARQFSLIIDHPVDHWAGSRLGEVGLCRFGAMYFTLAEMQIVVDHLDDYLLHHGTRQAVGRAVMEWAESRPADVTHPTYPHLAAVASLRHWLLADLDENIAKSAETTDY